MDASGNKQNNEQNTDDDSLLIIPESTEDQKQYADPETKLPEAEVEDLERAQKEAELLLRDLEAKQFEQNIRERREYATLIFCLTLCWLVIIISVLVLQGFSSWTTFSLSDNVLMALIGGTTVNVVGTLYIVLKYLFPEHRNKDKNSLPS